jgi:hypothetical protein
VIVRLTGRERVAPRTETRRMKRTDRARASRRLTRADEIGTVTLPAWPVWSLPPT